MSEQASERPLAPGSTWRRWDPHVHLPGTLFNDQFGDMSITAALDDLAAREPRIEAVGITDYFTTATYREAVAAHQAGAGEGIEFLFPNVELRLDVQTGGGSGVNVHLMCAPEDVDWLDQFVGRLEFLYRDQPFRADAQGLRDLGRAFRAEPALEANSAMREGAKQFKVSFKALRELYRNDASAAERLLVAFAGGQGDGTSGVRSSDGGFAATRQQMERFAQIIFSGSEQQRGFWLGNGADSVQKLTQVYGGLKPCLHGSDAHGVAKLGRPDQDRYTWLKGDPRFDTLRLACMAPETRAAIGPASPAAGAEQGRIASVTVNDDSWFSQGTVPINTGLVAIIGARGSGKTALADLVAVGAGSSEPFTNSSSFVFRARPLLGEAVSAVRWHGGAITERPLGEPGATEPDEGRVRYLSQQFVERLCASDGVSDELLSEIERVIYNAWPVEHRQGAVDFRELLEIRLGAARDQQRAELETIGQISDEITDQRVIKNNLPRKRESLRVLQGNAQKLDEQIRSLTGQSGASHAEQYGRISQALAERQDTLQGVDRRITELRALAGAIANAEASMFPRFVQTLQGRYPQVGLTSEQWSAFLPHFTGDVSAIVQSALLQAETERRSTVGEPESTGDTTTLDGVAAEELATRSVSELKAEQARLAQLVGLDTARAAQLKRLQEQAADARARISKLGTEIVEGEGTDDRAAVLVKQRAARYEAYFNAILEEEEELGRLYAPLRAILENFGSSVAKLRLSTRRRVDLSSWVKQGENLIDLRTAGTFRGTGEMARIAKEALHEAWATGDGERATEAIQRFADDYSQSLRDQSKVSRDVEAGYRDWERQVAQWLYGVDHISVVYSLEYDGLDVQRLSPGTRGIVLLLLYLAVDQSETDPLIIDQPEENLDPESVYAELVTLFRRASARRQIIMVTHNANLVVNTDVDQVLVAHCGSLSEGKLPRFSYLSGGLEDPDVRKAVCDVLEGGEEAFRQRARRLHIDAPSVPRLTE